MKRGTFKQKSYSDKLDSARKAQERARKASRSAQKPLRRTKLRKQGKGRVSTIKRRIQKILRETVIRRDGGCIFRVVLGGCSGPLQAEHLNSRSFSHTFADTRNLVCLCQYHHIFWKPQHSRYYWELIEQHLGKDGWKWLKEVEKDKSAHKMNWPLIEENLIKELEDLPALQENK